MDNIKNINKSFLNENDPYKIFDANKETSLEDISKTYKIYAKEYHPDRHSTKSESERKEIADIFSRISSAYNKLKDPEQRKRYDYELDLEKLKIERQNVKPDFRNTLNGFDPRQTVIGGFNLNNLTDNKIDIQELKNNKAELSFQNGKEKFSQSDFERAIADFQTSIELNSQIAKYHTYLGLAMMKKGWNGYAIAEFKISLTIDPNDKIAKNNLDLLNKDSEKETKDNKGFFDKFKWIFKKN